MPNWARLACFCLALSLEVIESIVALLLLKASTELFNLLLYRPVCYELVSSELFSMLVPHCRAQVSSKLTSIHTHSLWLEIEEGVSTGTHTAQAPALARALLFWFVATELPVFIA